MYKRQPVYKLLGGKQTDRIMVYASAGQLGKSPDEIRREAEMFKEQGFLGYKVRVTLDDYREKAKAAREGLGKDLCLMIEWNMRLPNVRTAINAIRNIERYEITWVEEPLRGSDIEGYAKLRKAVDVPISGGESLATRWEFKERLEKEVNALLEEAGMKLRANIITPENRQFAVWIGASRLASLPEFQKSWIRREEYEREGPRIIHRAVRLGALIPYVGS